MKKIRSFDFGGSGVRTAVYDVSASSLRRIGEVVCLGNPDYNDLSNWLGLHVKSSEEILGISCAGFVNHATGINHVWAAAGWMEFPLAGEVRRAFPAAKAVWCLNDGEAHLVSGIYDYPGPLLAIAIGTSVALAVSDEQGRILRTRVDRPLECGGIRLKTRAANNEVWWALGSNGLKELQDQQGTRNGARHFGFRIGAFAAQYAALFQVRTVMLSGGLIEYNQNALRSSLIDEFQNNIPHWMKESPPKIVFSRWGREAALAGAARYAFNQSMQPR